MHLKSISYELMISALIDACALTEDRKENLAIKRSFTTKQSIYSHALLDRLLNYLAGEDEGLRVVLDKIFEVLEEAMKNMSSSPFILEMSNEKYNDEFKKNLVIPFISLLLFNMRFHFTKVSPVFYFIDFISKTSLTSTNSLDASIREYIRANLKCCNLPSGFGDDFKIFVGKISLNHSLKLKTIEVKIGELKSECEFKGFNDFNVFVNLSLSFHGMRLVLYFKDYIDGLVGCFDCARSSTKHKENVYWNELSEIAQEVVIRKGKKIPKSFCNKVDVILKKSLYLSNKYHENLARKYNIVPDKIFNYLRDVPFCRNSAFHFLQKNKQLAGNIYYDTLDVFIEIYDGKFAIAKSKISLIIHECEKYPSYRGVSSLSKLYIALLIKENGLKIKNNTLESYIYKSISTDRLRQKLIVEPEVCFLNKNSLFSNNATFYTIIHSLSEWHSFIQEMLRLDVRLSVAHDIEFTAKIEDALNNVYIVLDNKQLDLSHVEDDELKNLLKSTLTTDVLMENVITFIPNLTLYFALREINVIHSGLSVRMADKSVSINRFLCESSASKRKLLKAINLSEYMKDLESEKKLQSVT